MRLSFLFLLCLTASAFAADAPQVVWKQTAAIEAPEANQAAAADEKFAYAVDNAVVVKYDRQTGKRIAASTGEAKHLNSAFLLEGKLYCAHSNYPRTPEQSEIKSLDVDSMKLTTFKDFGNFGGSLTWCLHRDEHWWCNFAKYGQANGETFLVQFDKDWKEIGRWTYPAKFVKRLGAYSVSGGIWRDDLLCVTDHDHGTLYRLKVPKEGKVLEWVDEQKIPFTGQGIAADPKTGGLVGIYRGQKKIVFAESP
jgi:hypothetical protein